jgi:uncharacterized protein (UPF0335 family)
MDETLKILIIIVSGTLSLFLIVGIVLGVVAYHIMQDVRRITQKAEKVIDSAESVSEIFRQATGPFFIVKILRNIIKSAKQVMKEDK